MTASSSPDSDPARWRKVWHPALLNVWQYLALVGLVMTVAAHALLLLTGRTLPGFGWLYVVWVSVFVLGAARNLTHVPGPDDDHHHH